MNFLNCRAYFSIILSCYCSYFFILSLSILMRMTSSIQALNICRFFHVLKILSFFSSFSLLYFWIWVNTSWKIFWKLQLIVSKSFLHPLIFKRDSGCSNVVFASGFLFILASLCLFAFNYLSVSFILFE